MFTYTKGDARNVVMETDRPFPHQCPDERLQDREGNKINMGRVDGWATAARASCERRTKWWGREVREEGHLTPQTNQRGAKWCALIDLGSAKPGLANTWLAKWASFRISTSSLTLGRRLSEAFSYHCSERSNFQRILAHSATLAMIQRSRLRLQQNLKLSFMDAVLMSRSSEAIDPHDKIYGVLGIAAEFEHSGQVSHKPDYSRTVAEVYTMATAFVVRSRHDLACLTLVCDSSLKNIKDLPSWCPDYSASVPPLRDHVEITRTWQLGLSWPDVLIPEILGTSILRVDGSLFDVVAETSTLLKDSSNHPTNHGLSAVFNLATLLEDRNASTCSTRQIHAPFETLWRTLILDDFDYKAPAPATTAFLVPAFIAYLLCAIYTLTSEDCDKLGIGSDTRTLEINR